MLFSGNPFSYTLLKDPKFHASFAWTNKDDIYLEDLAKETSLEGMGFSVDCIQVQTGNRFHRIHLLY